MTVATFGFIAWSFTKPRSRRIFHYITAAITLVAAIAYFTMASDLGQTPITVQFKRTNPKVSGTPTNQDREIFYVRYIDWYAPQILCLRSRSLINAGQSRHRFCYSIFS